MARIVELTSLSEPGVEAYASLTGAQLRARQNPQEGLFIAESPQAIAAALNAGCQPVSLLMERRHVEGKAREIIARCGDVPVYTGERELLSALTGYELTRGVLCAMRRPELPEVEAVCTGARRLEELEVIEDPTIVVAIFRSAAALGMDAVLLNPTCCDPLSRRAIRVSIGTVFQILWTRIGARAADWPHPGLDTLKSLGFTTAALALTDRSISVEDPSLRAAERLALVLGTEGSGLMPETIGACDCTVRIPMQHGVDSLNVAAASAVAFWETRIR